MIRLANVNDIIEINKLLFQVQEIHADLRPDLFKVGGKKYGADELEKIITQKDETPIFVFEEDDKIVGYAFCIIFNHFDNSSNYKNLYIDDLCVNQDCRGKGIGTALYNHVLNYAKGIGCYNVTLNVWEGNDEAMEFYKHVGMKIQKTGMEKIL
ncbi:GNAT family N-acetyltransferase [uncultured Methanobrevibacter sp.]|uniref:GNAT family N-acetyltransferase n=1 Tax=uncultured Methanobrevibacter sp. TaxID=253161 RepID=UPI00262FFAF0|nr:GNAT family N-acetyltransferase [uncultured Methanobrevibacter sp.]